MTKWYTNNIIPIATIHPTRSFPYISFEYRELIHSDYRVARRAAVVYTSSEPPLHVHVQINIPDECHGRPQMQHSWITVTRGSLCPIIIENSGQQSLQILSSCQWGHPSPHLVPHPSIPSHYLCLRLFLPSY